MAMTLKDIIFRETSVFQFSVSSLRLPKTCLKKFMLSLKNHHAAINERWPFLFMTRCQNEYLKNFVLVARFIYVFLSVCLCARALMWVYLLVCNFVLFLLCLCGRKREKEKEKERERERKRDREHENYFARDTSYKYETEKRQYAKFVRKDEILEKLLFFASNCGFIYSQYHHFVL